MIDTDLYQRYLHFKQHDGWRTPPGRAACALHSARIERLLERAIDLGVATVEWEYDDDYEAGDIYGLDADEEIHKYESGEWYGPMGVTVTVADEVASLWGITLTTDETRDPYARCVVADLASELEDELRQAIGDKLDATLLDPSHFPAELGDRDREGGEQGVYSV